MSIHLDEPSSEEKLLTIFLAIVCLGGIAVTANIAATAIECYKNEISINNTKDAPKAQPEITPAPAPAP